LDYIIIQKSSHPDFVIKTKDTIIYCKNDEKLACDKVDYISINAIKRYYINDDLSSKDQPIYESQIIGKVIRIIDNNIWNSISIKCWESSINSLNLRSILINK